MIEFSKPTVEYSLIWPLLLIFGVACAGVLVEAFVPRAMALRHPDRARRRRRTRGARGRRHGRQGPHVVRRRHRSRQARPRGCDGDRRAHGVPVGADPGAVVRRGPALRRAAPRRRPVGVRRTGGGPARHGGRTPGLGPRLGPHRGVPAADVRGRRHDDVPGGQRPVDAVRGARGTLAAALPAVRPGASPSAAQPGGGAEVLPAGRVLVRLLHLRHRARLRLRGFHAVLGHRRGDPQQRRQPEPTARSAWAW